MNSTGIKIDIEKLNARIASYREQLQNLTEEFKTETIKQGFKPINMSKRKE